MALTGVWRKVNLLLVVAAERPEAGEMGNLLEKIIPKRN